jgi:hypothetical protein
MKAGVRLILGRALFPFCSVRQRAVPWYLSAMNAGNPLILTFSEIRAWWIGSTTWGMTRTCGWREDRLPVLQVIASVFINDDERGVHCDYEEWVEGLAPHAPVSRHQHKRTGEVNADVHL